MATPERPADNGTSSSYGQQHGKRTALRPRDAGGPLPGLPSVLNEQPGAVRPGQQGEGVRVAGRAWAGRGGGREAACAQGAGQESCAGVAGAGPLVAERKSE